MRRHTIIYTHGAGRLGNQVLRFVHWIAWLREQAGDIEIVNLAFWPYASLFSLWRQHPGCVFPVRSGRADSLAQKRSTWPAAWRAWSEDRSRLPRLVQAAGQRLPGWQAIDLDITREESLDLDDPDLPGRIRQRRVTTCCGWKIASWPRVAAHEAALREFFRPAPEHAQPALDFIAALRERYDVLVGVLIRQTDYQEWHDGRFYFSTGQYAGWLRQLVDLHPGRRVGFVIASDERQDAQLLTGLPAHFATGTLNVGGHWFESWVELSLCDLIVSPPSTFSATAAFLGGVPLWPVVGSTQVMAFDQVITDGMAGAARHPVFSLSVK